MLLNVITGTQSQSGEAFLISGSSWSSCISYFENLGKTIISVSLNNSTIIPTDITSSLCYMVSLTDTDTNLQQSYIIYDTFENVTNWINSQLDMSVSSINKQIRHFVSI